jgi:ribosomal protein S18 acetylase RimI-like enzyme
MGVRAEEMMMNSTQAEQIAFLLNKQNKLDGEYDADRVLSSEDQYLFETDEATGDISAAVEIKRVQWYQYEILHLSVSPDHRREGLAKRLLIRAEEFAKQNRARILQCTIRADNSASCALFKSVGFKHTATFNNVLTGNNVTVWQKELIPATRSPSKTLEASDAGAPQSQG